MTHSSNVRRSSREPRSARHAHEVISLGLALLTLLGCASNPIGARAVSVAGPTGSSDAMSAFLDLEERYDAMLGVYAVDLSDGQTLAFRADDRFGFASTLKALAVGAALAKANETDVLAPIPVRADELVTYSPIIEEHVGGTVTLLEAADAAVRFSDNTAGNLVLDFIGGPDSLQQQLREIGDDTTEVTRREPELNDVVPGDTRDTSTPRALATSLMTFALGDVLDDTDRESLVEMLKNNTTGDTLIRAGAPAGWMIGDKTGTAQFGTRNDIAIAWPDSGEPPIVLAILSRRAEIDATPSDALLAEAAATVFDALAPAPR